MLQPLAIVVIGGIVASMGLSLLVTLVAITSWDAEGRGVVKLRWLWIDLPVRLTYIEPDSEEERT